MIEARPWLHETVQHPCGDVVHGRLPAHPLPLARAALARALHGMQQAVGLEHLLRVDDALVAAARVGVGYPRIHRRIGGGLLFPGDHAVLRVHLPGAVALAVGAVEGVAHGIAPGVGELAPVEVFPGAARGRGVGVGAQGGEGTAEGQGQAAIHAVFQEFTPLHGLTFRWVGWGRTPTRSRSLDRPLPCRSPTVPGPSAGRWSGRCRGCSR
jgi:hypothetical protein